jgi:CheY-like chemotaxis protein
MMTAAASVQQTSCTGVSVMVVEDDDDSREMLIVALEVFGARVMAARSAAQALNYLQAVRPDVLVSDLSMPEMDGFALLHAVRASAELKNLPAIAVTGHWDLAKKATQSGFQRFIRKPIDPMELCRAVGALAHSV